MIAPRAARIPLALAAGLALAACGGPTENEGLDREAYIELYVDLIRGSTQAPDSAAAAERRSEILREHGVTTRDIEAFVARHADDPAQMAAIWLSIERRLQGDTLPEP